MIDPTKLEGNQWYWVEKDSLAFPSCWREDYLMFFTGQICYRPAEITNAIPIPSPAELAAMREIVKSVARASMVGQAPNGDLQIQIPYDIGSLAQQLAKDFT